jgi:Aspartyl protease
MLRAPLSADCLCRLLVAASTVPAVAGPANPNMWWEWTRPQLVNPEESRKDTELLAAPTRLGQIGRILVAVMLNGKGPFHFVLDTGASHSTLSPRTAAALGLVPTDESPAVVHGITGTDQLPTVAIESLQAGDLLLQHTRLPVVSAPMLGSSDGILGAAGLTNERVIVDFQHDRVIVSRAHGPSAVADFVRIPAKRVLGGLISVRALMDRLPVNVVIDTGSERTIGNLALRDALHRRHPASATNFVTEVYGATSAVSSGEVEIAPVIALGSARIAGLAVVFGGFPIFKVWDLEAKPAMILGMDALGTLQALSIDFASGELYVRSPDMEGGVILDHVTSR